MARPCKNVNLQHERSLNKDEAAVRLANEEKLKGELRKGYSDTLSAVLRLRVSSVTLIYMCFPNAASALTVCRRSKRI